MSDSLFNHIDGSFPNLGSRTHGAIDVAVGLAGAGLTILAMPELATLGVLVAAGELASYAVIVGFGAAEIFGAPRVSEDDRVLIKALASPFSLVPGVLAMTVRGEQGLRTVAEYNEVMGYLTGIDDLLHSLRDVEKIRPAFSLFLEPLAEKFGEEVSKGDTESTEHHGAADTSQNPVNQPQNQRQPSDEGQTNSVSQLL